MKNSTTPKWAKQKNKAARHAARIRMARQWLPTYTGTHLVRAYREKFKVDVPTALNDLEEIGALTPEQAAVKRQAEQKRQEHLQRERQAKKQQAFYDRFPDSDDRFRLYLRRRTLRRNVGGNGAFPLGTSRRIRFIYTPGAGRTCSGLLFCEKGGKHGE